MDIENILVTTIVSNGRFKARHETAIDNNAILTQAISDLQCSTTINSFFNTAKEKQLYKFLEEIYRDEVQKSLKSDKNTMKIFLKIMHRELALHSSFEFSILKFKNIISCTSYRNNKINSGRQRTESDFEIISKFISTTKKLEEFHLYFFNDISKLEILKNNFNEIFQFWSLKEKKRRRPGLDLVQIDLALKKIEIFYERKCINKSTSALTSHFEKVVNFICDKLNMNDNLISPFSSIGVNKNGIFSTTENGIVSFIVSIGGITLFKTLSFRDAIFHFCIHNVVLRHLIITGKCRLFYQLVCHLASISVYAKKNRGKKFELPERIANEIKRETEGIVDFAMEH